MGKFGEEDDERPDRPKLEVVDSLNEAARKELSRAASTARKQCEENPSFRTQEFVDAVARQKQYVEKYDDKNLAVLLDKFNHGQSTIGPPYLYAVSREWLQRYPTEVAQ